APLPALRRSTPGDRIGYSPPADPPSAQSNPETLPPASPLQKTLSESFFKWISICDSPAPPGEDLSSQQLLPGTGRGTTRRVVVGIDRRRRRRRQASAHTGFVPAVVVRYISRR